MEEEQEQENENENENEDDKPSNIETQREDQGWRIKDGGWRATSWASKGLNLDFMSMHARTRYLRQLIFLLLPDSS